MRMIWEARAGLNTEMVQHKKRAEVPQLRRADRPSNPCARALGLLNSKKSLPDSSWNGHIDGVDWYLLRLFLLLLLWVGIPVLVVI